MPTKQKSYTDEFKQQIVDVYTAGKTVTELHNEYGVAKDTIYGWIKALKAVEIETGKNISLKEYNAIKKELEQLKLENEILKKATAIFARNK